MTICEEMKIRRPQDFPKRQLRILQCNYCCRVSLGMCFHALQQVLFDLVATFDRTSGPVERLKSHNNAEDEIGLDTGMECTSLWLGRLDFY